MTPPEEIIKGIWIASGVIRLAAEEIPLETSALLVVAGACDEPFSLSSSPEKAEGGITVWTATLGDRTATAVGNPNAAIRSVLGLPEDGAELEDLKNKVLGNLDAQKDFFNRRN